MTTLSNIQHIENQIAELFLQIEAKQHEIAIFDYSCDDAQFDEFLDDVEQSVTIYGIEFYPSDILKNCDPIAYRCAKSDYEANFELSDCEEYQDLQAELDELESELDDLQTELDDLGSED